MTKPQFIRSFSDDSVFLDAHHSVAQICRSFSGGDDALFQDPHPSNDEAAFQKAESFVPVPIPTICRLIPEDSFQVLVQRHVSGSAALTMDKSEEISSLSEISIISVTPEPAGLPLPTLKPPPPFKSKGRGSVLLRSLILIGKEVLNPEVAISNAAELLVSGAEIYWNKKLICSALIAPGSLLVIFSGSLLIGWIRRGKLGVSLPGVIEMAAVASTAFLGQWINAFVVEDGTKLAMRLLFSNAIRCLKKGLTGLLEKEKEPVLPI